MTVLIQEVSGLNLDRVNPCEGPRSLPVQVQQICISCFLHFYANFELGMININTDNSFYSVCIRN